MDNSKLSYLILKSTKNSQNNPKYYIYIFDSNSFEVENIIDKKNDDFTNDITYEEKQIDQLVYKLYGLTEGEINIVEGV